MAFCAGVSMLYSTAEHGSRCGRLTSRLALLLYAARSTRQQWFAETGPLAKRPEPKEALFTFGIGSSGATIAS
jgi:hypothetical protein